VLRVAGQRRLPVAARTATIHRLEIPHGRFERRIRLPSARHVLGRSELANGCLVVNLTKRN
jgi:HSP20 family molecular chaperone IbpA